MTAYSEEQLLKYAEELQKTAIKSSAQKEFPVMCAMYAVSAPGPVTTVAPENMSGFASPIMDWTGKEAEQKAGIGGVSLLALLGIICFGWLTSKKKK